MNGVPGVIQLLSKRASDGKTSPFFFASASKTSASLADRKLYQEIYVIKLIIIMKLHNITVFHAVDSSWHVEQLHRQLNRTVFVV